MYKPILFWTPVLQVVEVGNAKQEAISLQHKIWKRFRNTILE